MSRNSFLTGLAALALAGPALAAPPPYPAVPPTAAQPVDPARLIGRWYEILRTPNKLQSNCFAAYQEWSRKGDGYLIAQVCHRDSPTGRLAQVDGTAKVITADNTLFEASFFGGLLHAKYQVTDHAPDYSWLIATTADGRYPKLMARTPSLAADQEAALKQRMAKLGFNIDRLETSGG
jgi:apolipoprotein D and lipocalin family protein